MSLKFHALEVGSGDAFLLENNGWYCLFDAGGAKKKIVDLLKEKGIRKLDLAICSHNDKDHANGFLGLLELNSGIDIDEIWLPGTWAKIIEFVVHNGIPFRGIEYYYDRYKNMVRDREIKPFMLENKDTEEVPIESIERDLSILSEIIYSGQKEKDKFKNYERLIDYHLKKRRIDKEYWRRQYHILIYNKLKSELKEPHVNLNNIIEIANSAHRKGCRIKWFEPAKIQIKKYPHEGFLALNSNFTSQIKEIPNVMSLAIYLALTMENIYSLAFEYYKEGIPIVRFSADSDCVCQSVDPYKNNIIVTAPHHGSDANANVYSMIKGDNIIWVRSDRIRSKRPCQDFKNMNDKHCLACCKHSFKKEICFRYDYANKKWIKQKGNACRCK